MVTLQVNITANGRLVLPIGIRKRLGLDGGGAVLIEETDNGIVLRTVQQAVSRAQAIARRYTDGKDEASVDAFLSQRHVDGAE